MKLTTSEPKIRSRKPLSAKAAPESNLAPVLFIVPQSIKIPVEVLHLDSITHKALVLLKRGKDRPWKIKDVKLIKKKKGKKEKKEDKRDKKDNKNTKDLWSKKKIMRPIQKSACKIGNAKISNLKL